MAKTRSIVAATLLALLTTTALAATASAQDRWDWSGGGADDHRTYRLAGPGVPMLEPELRDTHRGQAFVLSNFDFNHNGRIEPAEARAANQAFLQAAGRDRAHFDWERRAGLGGQPRHAHRPWDRQSMRGYNFHQGRYGAVFTMKDVLFQTGSATLLPGAEDQLRPLADYLYDNPKVQVRIDGYTDAVGSDAFNLILSRNRALAVAKALTAMEISANRFQSEGHGKADPVASNETAGGRQLNRRVEVTLVGQKATAFD